MPLYMFVTEVPGHLKVPLDSPLEIILSKSSLSIDFLENPELYVLFLQGWLNELFQQ